MTTTDSQTVANTIAAQIGPQAFTMMGASQLLALGNGLQFKVGKNAAKITKVRVELDGATDTYTVRFFTGSVEKVRFDKRTGEFKTSGGFREVSIVSEVFCDTLRKVLETGTGMYLSL